MKGLIIINNNGINVADSREVAIKINKRHDNLMRDINGYVEILTSSKLRALDFFVGSTYQDSKGETRPCYLLTKQGCEMVANKMTGKKGVLFTAEYVQAFNKMEQHIKEPKKLSALEQLQLQNEAILEVNEKVDAVDTKVDAVNEKMNTIENNMPLFTVECKELQSLVKSMGTKSLGGYKTPAYEDKSLRGKVYADIQLQLKREFGVTRYEAIKHSQFEQAKYLVQYYQLPLVLKEKVILANNQLAMEG